MRSLLACLVPLTLWASPTVAAVPGFVETNYSSPALTPATGLGWAPDGSGRLFLLNQNGTVRVATMRDGELLTSGTSLVTTVFATESVHTNNACGLLGLAFDPNYAVNRYVYLFLTAPGGTRQMIVRYTDANGVGTARTVVVDNLPTTGQDHNGGALGFGPDGKLYWAIGDLGNGTGVNADLTSLASKVSRANPDGTPANDNPFNDGVGPNNEYIWAQGFRDPFTFTFQPTTGKLWVNVVGTGYEQVFVTEEGDHAGYSVYENNQPKQPNNRYITPVIKYRTNGIDTRNLTANGATRSGGVATFTTTAAHGFRKGEKLTVSGVTDASFDGTVYVASTPSATTWTAVQAGPDAASGGGQAVTDDLGGAITGGVFYDSTLFPPEYRGNFFFGDFNSHRVVRATLAVDNSVATVDSWGTDFTQAVDMDVGPDGALYVVGSASGNVTRVMPEQVSQKLIVSGLNQRVAEGGRSVFTVRLAQAPTADVTVTVQRASGDADLTVADGEQLTFTPANWNQPQLVTIAAADDTDKAPDLASFAVAAQALSTETVVVTSIDNNAARLVLSTTALTLDEGGSGTVTVALSRRPDGNVSVTVARTAGDTDVSVTEGETLRFTTSNWNTPRTVTVAAAEDADSEKDTATLTVAAAGVDARTVSVTVKDKQSSAPTLLSTPITTAVVGAPYRYEVLAAGEPTPTFSLTSTVPGPSIDAATGVVTWTPTAAGTVEVVVRATNGVSPDAEQSFRITVEADEPPPGVPSEPDVPDETVGCGCDAGAGGAAAWLAVVLLLRRRRT
ncbi:PQQ-dependent sugar dehydrogenase [Cystobacter ferrugineus]|uniref:PQQ-dependent sugar dehydrogenase n=1 Tax=Cystobacter ferrugineus TaxID=83449 RepID=UPI0009FBB084|nr:PQQ-dependent sugar dehydrogenase [Cystobacter ferrugineus]